MVRGRGRRLRSELSTPNPSLPRWYFGVSTNDQVSVRRRDMTPLSRPTGIFVKPKNGVKSDGGVMGKHQSRERDLMVLWDFLSLDSGSLVCIGSEG